MSYIQKNVNLEGAVFSVTAAELSDKLSRLKIFFSVWPDHKEADMVKSLEGAKKALRKFLAEKIKTKFVPDIEFVLDESERKRIKIEELLSGSARSREARNKDSKL